MGPRRADRPVARSAQVAVFASGLVANERPFTHYSL